MKIIFAFLLILYPVLGFSVWAPFDLGKFVKESDYVVIGTLRFIGSSHSNTGQGEATIYIDEYLGELEVSEVLHGDVKPGTKFKLNWFRDNLLACPVVEHMDDLNKPYIWLLKRGKEPLSVNANHPSTNLPLEKKSEVIKFLQKIEETSVSKSESD